jgi:hypothetical protein
MPAHGVSGFFRRMGADRLKDRLVLLFDAGQILPRAFGAAFKRANALPRNNQAAEKIQKFDKAAVLRGGAIAWWNAKSSLIARSCGYSE